MAFVTKETYAIPTVLVRLQKPQTSFFAEYFRPEKIDSEEVHDSKEILESK
jgi:hypothetical protein